MRKPGAQSNEGEGSLCSRRLLLVLTAACAQARGRPQPCVGGLWGCLMATEGRLHPRPSQREELQRHNFKCPSIFRWGSSWLWCIFSEGSASRTLLGGVVSTPGAKRVPEVNLSKVPLPGKKENIGLQSPQVSRSSAGEHHCPIRACSDCDGRYRGGEPALWLFAHSYRDHCHC